MRPFFTLLCLILWQTFSIGQEIGVNDFRISFTGDDKDKNYEAKNTAVAYNNTNKEYLVVWASNQKITPNGSGEYEIWAQRYNAVNGTAIGSNFRVSDMGPDGSDSYGANAPAVAYNSTNNEYLVVWYGDNDEGGVGGSILLRVPCFSF